MSQPPFTFGVLLSDSDGPDELRARVVRAEQLGFHVAYLSDHLGHRLGPIASLAVAGLASSRLRVGTLVLNCAMRNPIVLAQELATLDLLSAGRLEIGLGAGWLADDFRQAGLPMEPPGARLRRLAEYIDILERFWACESFTFHGEFYQLDDVSCTPRPWRTRPRLLVGAAQPRALKLAARHAAVISIDAPHPSGRSDPAELLAGSTRDAYLERAELTRAEAQAAHRTVTLQMQAPRGMVRLNPTRVQLAAITEQWGSSPADLAGIGSALIGDLDDVAARLVTLRADSGISEIVVQAGDMEAAAPLVARLAG